MTIPTFALASATFSRPSRSSASWGNELGLELLTVGAVIHPIVGGLKAGD
jgi:hypothetical protein